MIKLNRRHALMGGALSVTALTLGVAACTERAAPAGTGEMSLGNPDAAVTVVEYASITCPHCAVWNETVWPEFKRRYVDTNLIRYVFRELPTPPAQIATAGFLLARCAGEERYFPMLDSMMRNQQTIVQNPRQELLNLARTAGMNEAQFDACVTDPAAIEAMNTRIQEANAAGVTGTPYFLINGEVHQDISIDGFEAALRPLIGGAPPPAAGEATTDAAAETETAPAAQTEAAPAAEATETPAEG